MTRNKSARDLARLFADGDHDAGRDLFIELRRLYDGDENELLGWNIDEVRVAISSVAEFVLQRPGSACIHLARDVPDYSWQSEPRSVSFCRRANSRMFAHNGREDLSIASRCLDEGSGSICRKCLKAVMREYREKQAEEQRDRNNARRLAEQRKNACQAWQNARERWQNGLTRGQCRMFISLLDPEGAGQRVTSRMRVKELQLLAREAKLAATGNTAPPVDVYERLPMRRENGQYFIAPTFAPIYLRQVFTRPNYTASYYWHSVAAEEVPSVSLAQVRNEKIFLEVSEYDQHGLPHLPIVVASYIGDTARPSCTREETRAWLTNNQTAIQRIFDQSPPAQRQHQNTDWEDYRIELVRRGVLYIPSLNFHPASDMWRISDIVEGIIEVPIDGCFW